MSLTLQAAYSALNKLNGSIAAMKKPHSGKVCRGRQGRIILELSSKEYQQAISQRKILKEHIKQLNNTIKN